MENLLYWVWLSEKCAPDTPTFSILYHTFGSVEKIYSATEEELTKVFSLNNKQITALSDKKTDRAVEILKICQKENIGILPYGDELFPSRLRTIKNPPVLLYYKGRLPDFDKEVCIGTVGTRTPSPYGCRCAYEISFDLALNGAFVVSGMAFGIDSVCHKAALDAGGKTVAVLGCGVDIVYPKENSELYDSLSVSGTLISEYAPGTKATRYSFPQRNRIISGLSLGTLVIEAQIKSGAMITAQKTKEQNRDLFAIPGRLGEYNSLGPNSLIQSGAIAVKDANDILREYEFLYPEKIRLNPIKNKANNSKYNPENAVLLKSKPKKTILQQSFFKKEEFENITLKTEEEILPSFDNLPDEQRKVALCLSKNTPKTLEEIAKDTNISVSDIMSSLTILEIQGIVNALPGGCFILS
ncbi:MAG: DNA-protecting protein DprA [Ruminococcaceae bacterium]|nr:DNA-protecting protein DprA [Oscillospiraceae bacterium]